MVISGKTKVYGVIGDPIEHTLSPALHNAAFEASQMDCVFLSFKVQPAHLGKALAGVQALNIRGLSVTMPHKNAVLAFLDEVDPAAKALGAVNCVKNVDGKLVGFNTDGVGALNALKANGVDPEGKRVVLFGAGGAARAIAYTLAQQNVELAILNRTLKPAAELADLLFQDFKAKVVVYALSNLTVKACLADADVVINASSVGMKPNDSQTLVPRKLLTADMSVMDIVYDPLETKLAKEARAAGAKVVSGVEMLICQGAASFEIWTGCPAPVEVMRKAALNQLGVAKKS